MSGPRVGILMGSASDLDAMKRCAAVLFSPVFAQPRGLEILGCPALPPHELVAWILDDALPVRLQVQMHKYVWAPTTRGV